MMPEKKNLENRLLRMKILVSGMVSLFPYKVFLVLSALCLCHSTVGVLRHSFGIQLL